MVTSTWPWAHVFYRALTAAVHPALPVLLRARAHLNLSPPPSPDLVRRRLGHYPPPVDNGPTVWFHGVSVGECMSAVPLIRRTAAEFPHHQVVVTAGTDTAVSAMVKEFEGTQSVRCDYAPYDTPAAVESFLKNYRPRCGFILESELWPNLLHQAQLQRVRISLINGRMSARSQRAWSHPVTLPLARAMMGAFEVILAQSPTDAGRLRSLCAPGSTQPEYSGNLKLVGNARRNSDRTWKEKALARVCEGRPTWVAASTHEGEEELALEVHEMLHERAGITMPITIVAPRHPHRAGTARQIFEAGGHLVKMWSSLLHGLDGIGSEPPPSVIIVDTIGDLGDVYAGVKCALIGGSFAPRGGHNLMEALREGCPAIHGPHMWNFEWMIEAISSATSAAGVVTCVREGSAKGVIAALDPLLQDANHHAQASAAARHTAESLGDNAMESIWAVVRTQVRLSTGIQ